ncbi:hypothetical protein OG453_25265 [Streptomyces sp. NBC_01381]|uniref:hypothetical protein n=1 Tax=Streptomyces sp. NBC_01381 TaxID=2903845 RepID=UPI00224CB72C|nr:hypothetical protein [Streptomyces sp. NBC_01381]MCX4669958.1 hypothetical protein [Streptomyces sp. NBC_01381]
MNDGEEFVAIGFSPAAELAVEEAVEEFENNLRQKAAIAAASEGNPTTIANARHVAEATAQLMAELGDPKGRKAEIALFQKSLWVAMGIIAAAGFIVFAIAGTGQPWGEPWTTEKVQLFSTGFLVGPMVGLIMNSLQKPLMLIMEPIIKRSRRTEIRPSFSVFMAEVTALEISIRSRMSETFGESRADQSLSDLVDRFSRAARLSSDDHEALRAVLAMRNKVTHGRYSAISPADLTQATNDARRLSSKFRSIALNKAV